MDVLKHMIQPTNDADNTMSSTEAAASAAALTSYCYSSPVIMVSGITNIVHLTDTEYADAIETDEVHVRAETDSGSSSQANSGTSTSSLSSSEVQQVVIIPLVADVQLACPVSSSAASSSSSSVEQADAVKQAQLSRVRTHSLSSESSSEEEHAQKDNDDIPYATAACVNREWDWATDSPSNVETTSVSYSRPQIIFANAIKPSADSLVGLHFRSRNGAVYISSISVNSIFRGCNLRVGDRVVAVNNISCIGAKRAKNQVVKLLHQSNSKVVSSSPKEQDSVSSLEARTISICVRNEHGDPRTVSTSVQKPDRFARLGVALVDTRGSLKVTRVDPDSLFSNSLLLPRHRCLHINSMPCDHLSAQEAAKFILAAPDRVTIISEPHQHAAMVISASQEIKGVVRQLHEAWWRNAAISARSLAIRLVTGRPASSQKNNTPRLRIAC